MLLFFSKLKALLEYKNVSTTVFFNFTIQIYAKIPSLLLSIFEVGRLQNQSIYFLTKYKEWKMFIVVVCLFFLFRFSFSFLLFFFVSCYVKQFLDGLHLFWDFSFLRRAICSTWKKHSSSNYLEKNSCSNNSS